MREDEYLKILLMQSYFIYYMFVDNILSNWLVNFFKSINFEWLEQNDTA